MIAECATLWIGERLGPIERACLRSILRQGHRLVLYCYEEPAGVPEGVEVRDAAAVLPEQLVFRHLHGSVAFFADWFRYELLRRGLGPWVDTDAYLVAPLTDGRPYLFGEQEPGLLNNAILHVPADSPVLTALLEPFEGGRTPDWLPLRYWLPARMREFVYGRADLSRLPWGSTGPHALTAVARQHGLLDKALPRDVFYPVPWRQAHWIRDPRLSLDQMITPRTVAIHLWNECIKPYKEETALEGSFLDRMQREGE